MSIYKTRSQLFRRYASENKLVSHDRTIDGEKRKSFHRMNEDAELNSGILNWIHFPCVVHMGFRGRFSGGGKNMTKVKPTNILAFITKVDDINDMDALENAYDITFEVMHQFVSKMYTEFLEKIYCSPFDNLDLSRFTFETIEYGTNLFGWILSFEDENYLNSFADYKAEHWYED